MIRLLSSLLLASGSCTSAQTGSPPTSTDSDPTWKVELVFERAVPLNACAVGDVDPRYPGNEIAAVTRNGEVLLAHLAQGTWTVETVARMPGELLHCMIGDADPTKPGNELVVAGLKEGHLDAVGEGGAGAAYVIYPPKPRGWSAARIFLDEAPLRTGFVADVDPSRAGEELVFAGDSRALILVFREGGGWSSEAVAELEGGAGSSAAFEAGVALACDDGAVYFIERAEAAWSTTELDRAGPGRTLVAACAASLVVGSEAGRLALLEDDSRSELLEAGSMTGTLRGLVLADLVPETVGLETAAVSSAGGLYVVLRSAGSWQVKRIADDPDGLLDLAAGELFDSSPGPELVACGSAGRLWLVRRVPAGEGGPDAR